MQRNILVFALTLSVFSLAACGGPRQYRAGGDSISDALGSQYNHWKGTPYKVGGLSKSGIDCSGFVQVTFRDRLSKRLPRTTGAQAKYGKEIGRRSLKPGDLVFFRTGKKVRHVGIYMGGNRFLHASTSKGVMISSMDNVYWKDRFWQARRVL